jgi:hypothetical protein
MDDEPVIHLDAYRKQRAAAPRRGLALSGAEGERRHFALPLWRMASAAGADWAAVVRWVDGVGRSVTVLDLDRDRPRDEPPQGLPSAPSEPPPAVIEDGSTRVLPIGAHEGDVWAVVLSGAQLAERMPREELLFLAGECAGLLMLEHAARLELSPSDPSDA